MSLKPKNLHDFIPWILFVSIATMLAGDIMGEVLLPPVSEDQAFLFTFNSYAIFAFLWVVLAGVIIIFKKNRFILMAFKPTKAIIGSRLKGNTLYALGAGLLVGFLLNGVCALIAYAHGDFTLEFKQFDWLYVLALCIAVFIQSAGEEALCRGFMYQRLLHATHKPYIAVWINAVFFGVMHLFNDGMSLLAFYDMVITGVFFSLVVVYFDSLWMAMGIHTTWNFTQSILLGLPNSGASFPYSIFGLDAGAVHASFAYNAAFGLEGTLLSASVMTLCCIGLYLHHRFSSQRSQTNQTDCYIAQSNAPSEQ